MRFWRRYRWRALEDHACKHAHDDVDDLGGNKREVDDRDRSVVRLIGPHVVGEPAFKGDGGGMLRLDDGSETSAREEAANTKGQGIDELTDISTGLVGSESFNVAW